MKVILITGLDGSGKTSFLNRIKEHSNPALSQIINLPHINTETLKQNTDLYKAALFVNSLNQDADLLKLPQLKAVALFASMILYREIFELIKQKGVQTIFCERHPLIDSGIYARFYAEKLHPGSISLDVLSKLDEKYSSELQYLLSLLPEGIIESEPAYTSTFINFIYKWFHLDKKYDIESLKAIFNIDFPDKIYYLQASPEILYERIKNRKVLEAHESVEVFVKLDKAYMSLFNELNQVSTDKVEIINIENTDQLFIVLKQLKYF